MSEAPPEPRPEGSAIAAVARRRAELGDAAPRIALVLFEARDLATVDAILDRVPETIMGWFEEIVVMRDAAAPRADPTWPDRAAKGARGARFLRPLHAAGAGGERKAAFEYTLGRGFDHVVTMRADGLHPPEALPALLCPIHQEPNQMIFANREMRPSHTPAWWRQIPNLLAHVFATGFQNRLLGLRLRDYHSSFRVYSLKSLARIPFQLNSDQRQFDMQLVIQCRVLGVPIVEVPVSPTWREYPTRGTGLAEVLRACRCALDYRLHQLHVYRLGQYFVDRGTHYTFKHSAVGSHMQIVAAVAPGSRVLDLGCSQGLLAAPLEAKGARVVGVDIRPPEGQAPGLEQYFQRDLDQPIALPCGREFDYVVISDVIEHLRNRVQLLRGSRRFLKEGGRLIISTPNVALWFYRLSLLVGRFEYGPRGVLDETHVHLFTRATFRREVEKAGFRVVKERVTSLPFEIVFESTGRSRLVRSVNRAYHALARLWPTLFAYQHILEAEITTLDEDWVEGARDDGRTAG